MAYLRGATVKVVLDTNIWISGLLWGGLAGKVLKLAELNQIKIIGSNNLVNEIYQTLQYPKLQSRLQFLGETPEILLEKVKFLVRICSITISLEVPQLGDPNDVFILEIAICGNAKLIVTGDNNLLTLK